MTKKELEKKCKFLEKRLEKIYQTAENADFENPHRTLGMIMAWSNPEYLDTDAKDYIKYHKD